MCLQQVASEKTHLSVIYSNTRHVHCNPSLLSVNSNSHILLTDALIIKQLFISLGPAVQRVDHFNIRRIHCYLLVDQSKFRMYKFDLQERDLSAG